MAPVLSAQSHARTEAIRARKGGEPIVCLTAYTYPIARLLEPHVDLLLVGDSVAMVLHGHENTLGATTERQSCAGFATPAW
jgi:3-methyl-2-oxobutanoate hydroxymethyltransferase